MRQEKAVSDICYLKFFVCIDGIQLAKSLDKKLCDSLSVIYGRSAFFPGSPVFPPIKLTATIELKMLLKVALNIITPNLISEV
jgi:hypothetical protein